MADYNLSIISSSFEQLLLLQLRMIAVRNSVFCIEIQSAEVNEFDPMGQIY